MATAKVKKVSMEKIIELMQSENYKDRFKAEYFDLIKRYEMDEDDNIWLNTYKLKEIGVDIESWNRDGETE